MQFDPYEIQEVKEGKATFRGQNTIHTTVAQMFGSLLNSLLNYQRTLVTSADNAHKGRFVRIGPQLLLHSQSEEAMLTSPTRRQPLAKRIAQEFRDEGEPNLPVGALQ